MVRLEHFADDTGALAVARVGAHAHFRHAVQNTPLDWLEAVTDIGEGALDDNAHRVVEIRAAHLRIDVDGLDVANFHENGPPLQGRKRVESNPTSISVLASVRRNGLRLWLTPA
jgi:hypothetical protein